MAPLPFLRAFLILCIAALVSSTELTACKNLVKCPCGNTGHLFKICSESADTGDPCRNWKSCKSCQDGLDSCLECPDGVGGNFCDEVMVETTKSRQKRQSSTYNQGNRTPRQGYPGDICSDVQSPELGSLRCESINRERTCVGTCLPGYTFENSEESDMALRCQNGVWTPSRQFPKCVSRGICTIEMRPGTAGRFNCTIGMDGTYCDVFCGPRYSGRYYCYPNRDWNPQLPTCVRPKGGQSPGEVRQQCRCQYGGSCRNGVCVCPVGRTGQFCESVVPEKRTCNDPGTISNGVRRVMDRTESSSGRRFEDGEWVVFSCRSEEYALQGSAVLICKNGSWSQALPKCIRIRVSETTCPDPGGVANADRQNSDDSPSVGTQRYKVGQSVVYRCRPGFTLQRRSFITCLVSGSWSQPRPYCQRINTPSPTTKTPEVTCPDPGEVLNADRMNSDGSPSLGAQRYKAGQSVAYTCHPGYALKRSSLITCLDSGSWSSLRPYCRIINTPTPAPPPETVTVGPTCPDPGEVPNADRMNSNGSPSIGAQRYNAGQSVTYTCHPGYSLQRPGTITCLASGSWSDFRPYCRVVNIPTPAPPPETLTMGRMCPDPGEVENADRLKSDGSLSVDIQAFMVGQSVEYACHPGFSPNTSPQSRSVITCLASGSWSHLPLSCKRNKPKAPADRATTENPDDGLSFCREPGVDLNGYRVPDTAPSRYGFPPDSHLQYFCKEGFNLVGEKNMFCEITGRWSSFVPKCLPKSEPRPGGDGGRATPKCLNPGDIDNGEVVYIPFINSGRDNTGPLEDAEYPLGSQIRYSCNPEYRLEGRASLMCEETGEWTTLPPICKKVQPELTSKDCNNPGPIQNGIVQDIPTIYHRRRTGYPQGTRLQYICNNGYRMQGESTLICGATGRWSADPPTCSNDVLPDLTMYCDNLGDIANGDIEVIQPMTGRRTRPAIDEVIEYPAGTRLEYSCEDGYALEGSFVLSCLPSGDWSSDPPSCSQDCGHSFVHTTRRIINGTKTRVGEWPWVVAIAVRYSSDYTRIVCGGAVVNTRTVVTAAHCLVLAGTYTLYFGKLYTDDSLDGPEVMIRQSTRIILHPKFNASTYDSDIGLLKFDDPIRYTNRIQPICLPSPESTDKNIMTGRVGFVTGWGLTERHLQADELLLARLHVLTQRDCTEAYRRENLELHLTQNMFCAGLSNALQSACTGDSGSPLCFYDKPRDRYTLEGVVSFTVSGQCGISGKYTIFTKVYHFVPWILRHV